MVRLQKNAASVADPPKDTLSDLTARTIRHAVILSAVIEMSDCTHREFLLSALRAASLRAKLFDAEINSIGIALRENMITPEQAIKWIKDIGALEAIGTIPDEIVKGNE